MSTFRYGGFWRRALAIWMDGLVIQFIMFLAFMTMKYTLPDSMAPDIGSYPAFLTGYVYLAGGVLMNMAYYTIFHGMGGQTPGKWVMGVKVIRDTGEEMTLGYAFLRWVGYLVSYIFFFLGFIWVAFDRRKQGWHDKIAGTLVIRTRGQYRGGDKAEGSPSDASRQHLSSSSS
ncbi:MAG: RDD family protein [Syntrophales bacterium]|nr:RDD family protein [Syntrophales bacterium]